MIIGKRPDIVHVTVSEISENEIVIFDKYVVKLKQLNEVCREIVVALVTSFT